MVSVGSAYRPFDCIKNFCPEYEQHVGGHVHVVAMAAGQRGTHAVDHPNKHNPHKALYHIEASMMTARCVKSPSV